jgi:hypothetical protein
MLASRDPSVALLPQDDRSGWFNGAYGYAPYYFIPIKHVLSLQGAFHAKLENATKQSQFFANNEPRLLRLALPIRNDIVDFIDKE